MKKAFLIFILSGLSLPVISQISGNNILEYQYGKLPSDSDNFSAVYDRAVLSYDYRQFNAGLTLEQFYTPYKDRDYLKLTQFSLKYDSAPFEITIGNYYETIGRGLLLRSYTIPGAILEDRSYRSQHYFYRDMRGFDAKFNLKRFSAKLIYGKPLNSTFPPVSADSLRRTDVVEALYADYSFSKQVLGGSVMRLSSVGQQKVYGMTTLSGILFPFMSYYMELAKNISNYNLSDFSGNSSYAFYGNLDLTFGSLGISAEYKDYKKFLVGNAVNEPPALVKEQTYKVLNRSTHVLQPSNETGYQLEAYYTFPDLSTLTLNNSLAVNNFGMRTVFREFFGEYDFTLLNKHDIKLFSDFAQDPFNLESDRISAGLYTDWNISGSSAIYTDYEFQTFNREAEKIQNYVLSAGYSFLSKIVAGFTAEVSNDPFLTDNNYRIWLGVNAKYQINPSNNIQLFAGQRRGGPACNAGVCYEVLDFNGVELRLNSRF